MLRLKPPALIVFDGLDKAGKTTALNNVLSQMSSNTHTFHMPSEPTDLGAYLYEYMEEHRDIDPLARQLMHLAAHAQSMEAIHYHREVTGLILDRWWWSTFAYGFYGANLDTKFSPGQFMQAVSLVWRGLPAERIYLFTETYEEDANNNDRVLEGYREFGKSTRAVTVPRGTEEEVRDFIINDMKERGLVHVSG